MIATVSERAVIARIRRALAMDCKFVTKNRGGPYSESLPAWIIVENNYICDGFNDPEEFARDQGLLRPHEKMQHM